MKVPVILHTVVIFALLAVSVFLVSCNTVTGVGEDIASLGRAMGGS